jgi:hypothetical protein
MCFVLFHSKHSFWNITHFIRYNIRIIRAPDSVTMMIYCTICVEGDFIKKKLIKKKYSHF